MKQIVLASSLLSLVALSPKLQAQQHESRAQRLFEQLDQNGDGVLNPDEIPNPQQRFFERTVRVGDADGDGTLSQPEFLQALGEGTEASSSQREENWRQQGQSDQTEQGQQAQGRLFDALDNDGDGSVNINEIPPLLRNRVAPVFESLGASEISREQFIQGMSERQGGDSPADAGSVPDFLTSLDPDGNGMVTRAEAPAAMAPVFDRLGLEEIPLQQLVRFNSMRNRERRPGQRMNRDDAMPSRPTENRPGPEGRTRPAAPFDGSPGPGRFTGRRTPPWFLLILDEDRSGSLSREELGRIEAMFDSLDEDGDGELNVEELVVGRLYGEFSRDGVPRGREDLRRRGPDAESVRPETNPGDDAQSDSPPMDGRDRRSPLDRPGASFRSPPRGGGVNASEPKPDSDLGRFDPANRENRRSVVPREGVPHLYVFRMMDANQDGSLSRDEVQGGLQVEFDRVDQNHDNLISQEEYERRLRTRPSRMLDEEAPMDAEAIADEAQ